jgi:acyl transferase domain-containing protein
LGAGVAGLIKLALSERALPGRLHFHSPNLAFDFEGRGLQLGPGDIALGDGDAAHRLCGTINPFGFGGAKAHVILVAAPPPAPPPIRRWRWRSRRAHPRRCAPTRVACVTCWRLRARICRPSRAPRWDDACSTRCALRRRARTRRR